MTHAIVFKVVLAFFIVCELLAGNLYSQEGKWNEHSKLEFSCALRSIICNRNSDFFLVCGSDETFVLSSSEIQVINSIPVGFERVYVAWKRDCLLCKSTFYDDNKGLVNTYFVLEAKTGKLLESPKPLFGNFVECISKDGMVVFLSEKGEMRSFREGRFRQIGELEMREEVKPVSMAISDCKKFVAVKWSFNPMELLEEAPNRKSQFTVLNLDDGSTRNYDGIQQLALDIRFELPRSFSDPFSFPSEGINDLGKMLFQDMWICDGNLVGELLITIHEDGILRKWNKEVEGATGEQE